MSDIEIIEFKIPSGAATLLYLTQIETSGDVEEFEVRSGIWEHFSQWGLLYSLNMSQSDHDPSHLYCYLRYYSARATASAKIDNKGEILKSKDSLLDLCSLPGTITLMGGRVRLKLGLAGRGGKSCTLPLSRSKCEELANFYLGFNGWSSSVLYHKSEDIGDPNMITFVTVVKLEFPSVS